MNLTDSERIHGQIRDVVLEQDAPVAAVSLGDRNEEFAGHPMYFSDPVEQENFIDESAKSLGMRREDLALFFKAGLKVGQVPENLVCRREMLNYLRRNESPPARWLSISGLWPEIEGALSGKDRRLRVRKIYNEAVRLIVAALKEHAEDPERRERSIFWDPVIEVCRGLEISQSKLSGFCKELTGLSLKQTMDCERVRGLREKMRAGLRGELGASFVTELGVSRKGAKAQRTAMNGEEKKDKWEVWKDLKAKRKWPEFSRDTWAQGFGFASYRRMYKACQAVFGVTPCQMEMGVIGEMVEGDPGEGKVEEGRVEGYGAPMGDGDEVGVEGAPGKEPRT